MRGRLYGSFVQEKDEGEKRAGGTGQDAREAAEDVKKDQEEVRGGKMR